MPIRRNRKLAGRLVALLVAAVAIVALSGASARADSMSFNLAFGNSSLSPTYPGPYASVTVDETSSTTATITFTFMDTGTYTYLFGAAGAVAVNVNATAFTVGTVTETNGLTGFTPSFDSSGSGQEDGFGSFNLVLRNTDGFTDSAQTIQFTITNTSGTWTDAADVLALNDALSLAAAHIFVCDDPCSTFATNPATGFAGNTAPTPEPSSMLLFAIGGISLAWYARRRQFDLEV